MDQVRLTNTMQQQEKRLHMTILTMLLDLAVGQAYSVYMELKLHKGTSKTSTTLHSFKQTICALLITPELEHWCKRKVELQLARTVTSKVAMMAVEILDDQVHQLIKNNGWKNNPSKAQDVHCLLCKLHGQQSTSIYGCIQFKNGFHVNSFTAYHI